MIIHLGEVYLSTSEVSKLLGVHPSTLIRWLKRGLIESKRIGYRYYFKKDVALKIKKWR